jgi:DNA excision repair protein ERCC-2
MAVKIDLRTKNISLGVGDLVSAPLTNTSRAAGIRTWTRLALGREAHAMYQTAQAELQAGYTREIFVRYITKVDEFDVKIQGRIDGRYMPNDNGHSLWIIEEIKSVTLPPLAFTELNAESYPNHTEQLRLYCYFAGQNEPSVLVTGKLVYINVVNAARKDVDIAGPFDDCGELIAQRIRAIIAQAFNEERRCEQRRRRVSELAFPHDGVRKHQDELMAHVEHALAKGRHLMISAPSGIGKTAGALYPTVKFALANDMRVFFVTAKNTQQQIAIDTLRKMNVPTAVSFRARESMCINDVYACREEFCPHLADFKAKLETTGIIDRLLNQRLVLPEAMMEAGRGARLCPFELALLEAERTDVVVCDYNYVFDPRVYFRRFFLDADYSDAILVIDEAHNLLQRAMDYYSPTLHRRQARDLAANLRHLDRQLAREFKAFLNELDEFFDRIASKQPDEYSQIEDAPWEVEAESARRAGAVSSATPTVPRRSGYGSLGREERKFLIDSPRNFFSELKPELTQLSTRYMLDKISGGRAIPDDPVEEFCSALGQFMGVLAMEGDEFSYLFDAGEEALKIVCKDPSRQLAERIAGFHSVIAMSATLEPMAFYRQMLGFDSERTETASFPSPFPKTNRKIVVMPQVATTFRQRSANYAKIAQIIATTASARHGNYMALFPSYEFMARVAEALYGSHGLAPTLNAAKRAGLSIDARCAVLRFAQNDQAWEYRLIFQKPKMTEGQRRQLLDALKTIDPPKLAFAVQGGLFAEGVDYPGELLSGIIVVSPALPQVNFERELMRRYYDERYGKGFEYAYLYPGMNRVVQSVGRLIRTETDHGVAVLVCQRFAQPQYASLFPSDWSDSGKDRLICDDLEAELRAFWAGAAGLAFST